MIRFPVLPDPANQTNDRARQWFQVVSGHQVEARNSDGSRHKEGCQSLGHDEWAGGVVNCPLDSAEKFGDLRSSIQAERNAAQNGSRALALPVPIAEDLCFTGEMNWAKTAAVAFSIHLPIRSA